MDKLSLLGVNPEVTKSEFLCRLGQHNSQTVSSLRLSLFNEVRCLSLLGDGDEPVTRKKSHQGKSVKLKHAEDVWDLVRSIRNNTPVNRVLLMNGKRSLLSLNESRSKSFSRRCPEGEGVRPLSPVNEDVDQLAHVSTVEENTPLIDNVFKSTVLSSLSSLKSGLAELKSNVRLVEQRQVESCNLQGTLCKAVPVFSTFVFHILMISHWERMACRFC